MAQEPVNFRNDEHKSMRLSTVVPQCILDLPPETHNRKDLSDEFAAQAMIENVNKEYTKLEFPKTMRLHRDPDIRNQNIGLISFIPSKNATPDPQGCFGVIKLRGNFGSEGEADSYSEELIRKHDSYAVIDYCHVGRPFPLMVNNEMYRVATKEVDVRKKVDDTIKDELRRKREDEKKEMESIQQRHRELMRDVEEDRSQKIDDLEYYVQLRTKKASLQYNYDELIRKQKESLSLIANVQTEIADLEKEHAEYKTQFLERYTDALKTQGINPEHNPLIKYMKD